MCWAVDFINFNGIVFLCGRHWWLMATCPHSPAGGACHVLSFLSLVVIYYSRKGNGFQKQSLMRSSG